ncbi:LytR family transcriptional regulator [Serinibacter arcticus]|uniref:LytR family transcriptional regulator n=2 Tax=Serinibacter arcticus TaxID=1655435 RepID=A0A2U2A0E0_9MICO|nr:LytR family transcriptional regulator [Serinibacter arcticus]
MPISRGASPVDPGAPGLRPGGHGGAGGPGGPGGRPPRDDARPPRDPRRSSRSVYRRRRLVLVAVVLVLLLVWPVALVVWADGRVQHTEALSGAAGTPGTTYLLAGSDSRADGTLVGDPTAGARTDTIMLLTAPGDGTASLVSLPRDTLVEIPGHGQNKLNAAYSFGGAPLLVQTVEGLTRITVDHYVEIGMGGVQSIVDAVGGVNLCWDAEVDDPESGMVWTPGCHDVDGAAALAFARMRKSDPTGDIGRGLRQQQVIQGVTAKLRGPSLLLPWEQVPLVTAGTDALVTDPGTGVVDLGRMALTFRAATGPDGFRGSPPIGDPDYRPGNLGSTVLLDEAAAALFWQQVTDGTLPTQAEQDAANGIVPEGQE